jgi:hypothetical protein
MRKLTAHCQHQQKVKAVNKNDKKPLVFAALLAMSKDKPEELVKLAKHYNRLDENLEKARVEYKESHQDNGKVIHVLKTAWLTAREAPGAKLLTSATYPEHHESVTGGRPTKRGYQCAVTFGSLVDGAKLISEADYDDNPSETITLASEIIGKAKGDLAHPAVIETAEILKRRSKKAIAQLKALKARFVEKTEGEGDDEKKVTVFLTAEEAEKLSKESNVLDVQASVGDLLAAGQCGAIINILLAHARSTAETRDAQALVHGVCQMRGALSENLVPETKERRFSDELLQQYKAEVEPAIEKDMEFYKEQYLAAIRAQKEVESLFVAAGNTEILSTWADEYSEPVPKNEETELVPK